MFHVRVLEKEAGPYPFKMQVFRDKKGEHYGKPFEEEDEIALNKLVDGFGAENVKTRKIGDKI